MQSKSSSPTSPKTNEGEEAWDPHARFVASDGLEYASFAKYLIQEPEDSYRNRFIEEKRRTGHSEEAIRVWYQAWDTYHEQAPNEFTYHLRTQHANHALDYYEWYTGKLDDYARTHGVDVYFGAFPF